MYGGCELAVHIVIVPLEIKSSIMLYLEIFHDLCEKYLVLLSAPCVLDLRRAHCNVVSSKKRKSFSSVKAVIHESAQQRVSICSGSH